VFRMTKNAVLYERPSIGVAPVSLEDKSRYANNGTHNNITLSRMASGLWVRNFDGTNSYVNCGAATQANFTNDSFTLMGWLYATDIGAAHMVMCQGVTDVDGWQFFIFTNNVSARTCQGGSHSDVSAVGVFNLFRWTFVVLTRVGVTGQFYVNGSAVTTIGAFADAVSVVGGNELHIGCQNNVILNMWYGSLSGLRIYKCAVPADQVYRTWESERRWYGL